jgi:hypothetical protein
MQVFTLKCSSCGGNLEITPDMDTFACGYCGAHQVVQRRGGTISLKLVTDAIGRVQSGTDKTAAELALVRMKEEMVALQNARRARAVRAENEKRSKNPLITGILILGLIVACVTVDKLGTVGFFLILGVTAGVCVPLQRSGVKAAEYAHGKDDAEFGRQIASLEARIAEKRKLADS